MRKSSSPSLSNCNSFIGNKIFGITLDELQHEGQSDNEVPYIVRHIVGYIEEHGLGEEGLFQVSVNTEMVEWLRQRYDNGEEVDLVKEADVPSAISLLRYFLQELPEPVIPVSLHIHLMQLPQDSTDSEDFGRKVKCILQQLPTLNFSLLKFLCRFLSNLVSRHDEMWSTGALAAVFGPDVFQIYTDVEYLSEQETAIRIVAGLLESYFEVFEAEDDEFSSTNDLSSITEQINDLFEDIEDEKLEQPEELPEDRTEKVDEMRDLLNLEMTEDIFEGCSVTASSSTRLSPVNILPASANILERSIRAAVEQHLFDLRSNLDQDLRNSQHPLLVCSLNAEEHSCDGEEIAKDKLNSSYDCSYSATGSDTETEAVPPDSEKPEQDTVNLIFHNEDEQTAEILLELINVNAEKDVENNAKSKRKTNGCFEDCNTFSSRLILDSYSEICDLSANPESSLNAGSSGYMYEDPVRIQIPHLELRSISEDDSFAEPCPAFKAWQDDAETGEAQLSPQAGRMNNPMEDDVFPILSHRYLDFGQSQRFLNDPEVADSSKALSFVRTRRASFSSKDDTKDDKTPHQLVKKLQKKIRQFEDQFERDNKYKPSYSDLAANPKVLRWMTDLTKLRKQIKDSKQKSLDGDFGPQIRPRSNTLPKSFGSSLDNEDEDAVEEEEPRVEKKPTREDTLELILKKLKEKRAVQGFPEEMKVLTKDSLAEEKTSLQRSLLYYESLHGRPVTREERQVVKPLYDRYRLVKQMLARASITPILGSPSTKRRGQMLQPIIEGETAHFFEEIKEEDEDGESMSSESSDTGSPSIQTEWIRNDETTHSEIEEHQQKMPLDIRLSSSRASSMPELMEQLWRARAEKKKLRKALREFEQQFFQQNGRNAQKEDRSQMLEEYREYKKIKAKLRLLEVLISKQDSSKSI